MYIKEFDITIDIKSNTDQEPFEVVQGDSQSNLLNISMTDGLEPYDLTGTTAEIVFYKSDSTTVQQTQESGVVVLNAPEGKIQCTLKTNTIACPGKVIAEIRISSDEILLTSARFEFYVRKSLINDKTIESTDEFPVLTQLMSETNKMIEQVNQIEKQVPENVVSRIDAMETGKANKNDMVQSDTISDATKYPSSVVTAAHRGELDEIKQSVTELNKNFKGTVKSVVTTSTLQAPGWYRVAEWQTSYIETAKFATGESFLMSIISEYEFGGHISAMLSVSAAHNSVDIEELSKSKQNTIYVIISKIRIGYTPDLKSVIDIYYTHDKPNAVKCMIAGAYHPWESDNLVPVNDEVTVLKEHEFVF